MYTFFFQIEELCYKLNYHLYLVPCYDYADVYLQFGKT